MSAEQTLTEYYDKRGKTRFMMVTSKEAKEKLDKRRKALGLSQGAMLEVFLEVADSIDPAVFNLAVQSKRGEKKSSRVTVSAINKQLKGLSEEQLLAIEKAIAEQKAESEGVASAVSQTYSDVTAGENPGEFI